MKRHIAIGLVIMMGVVVAVAERGYAGQKNPRKTIKTIVTESEWSADAENGPRETLSRSQSETYNVRGERVGWEDAPGDGTTLTRETVTHDQSGKKVLEGASSEANGVVLNRWVYTYDAAGLKVIGSSGYNGDGSLAWQDVDTVDSTGSKIRESRYQANGMLASDAAYTYDDRGGKKVQRFTYKSDGSIESSSTQWYGAKGHMSEARSFNAEGLLLNKMVFQHNPDGSPAGVISYDAAERMITQWVYQYDERGNKTKTEQINYGVDRSIESKSVSTYDANGNLVMLTSLDGNDTLLTRVEFTYEFDSAGNWVKKTMSGCVTRIDQQNNRIPDPNPCEVTRRQITYQ